MLRRDGTEKSRLRCVVCHLRRGRDAVQVSLSVSHSSRMMNSCRDRGVMTVKTFAARQLSWWESVLAAPDSAVLLSRR